MQLLKTGIHNDTNSDGFAEAGETISYSFTVTNTGDTTLTNITITDPLVGIVISGGPIASLAPGVTDSTTFTGTYTFTQADVDAGQVTNQATANAIDPAANAVTDLSDDPADITSDDDATVVKLITAADLAIAVTSVPLLVPGGTGVFTVTVTNNGSAQSGSVEVTYILPPTVTFDASHLILMAVQKQAARSLV